MSKKDKIKILMIVGYDDNTHPSKLKVIYGGNLLQEEEVPLAKQAINDLNQTVVFPLQRECEKHPMTSRHLNDAYAQIHHALHFKTWSWADEVEFFCCQQVWGTEL